MEEYSYIYPQELHESAENPRQITGDALERLMLAIEASPEMLRARPIIASTDGEVIAGNMRHRAITVMLKNPVEKFPKLHSFVAGNGGVPTFLYSFKNEAEKREWMLRDNNNYGGYVEDELAAFLRAGIEAGMDTTLTGFTQEELDSILRVDDVQPEVVDAEPVELSVYGVIVECEDEAAQAMLLEEFAERGYTVRAIL